MDSFWWYYLGFSLLTWILSLVAVKLSFEQVTIGEFIATLLISVVPVMNIFLFVISVMLIAINLIRLNSFWKRKLF